MTNQPRLLPDNRTKRAKKALAAEKRGNALASGWYKLDIRAGKAVPVRGPDQHRCPRCGAPMVCRNGKFGEFYGCSTYPKCSGSRDADGQSAEEVGVAPYNYSEDEEGDWADAFLYDVGDRD